MAVVEHGALRIAEREIGPVVPAELPELDEDHAARFGPWPMPRSRRIAYVGTRGIVTAFVLKHPVQHQDFLAARMAMGGKMAVFGVTHDRGRARFLIADAKQHAPL